jgi:hypothetical protein
MAQTTSGMSPTNMYVGVSTDGNSWVDVSGFANSVEISGGERETGNAYTFDGDTAIIKAGKRGPLTVTVRGVYTETADKFYDETVDAYTAGSSFYVRWSPGGGDSGDLGFTTSAGIVKNNPYPGGATDDATPVMVELVLECASVTEAAIGTAGW